MHSAISCTLSYLPFNLGRMKDAMHLHHVHYHISINLGLLQSNQTYMGSMKDMIYHWYLELLKLPADYGVEPFLKQVNTERKKKLEVIKTDVCR